MADDEDCEFDFEEDLQQVDAKQQEEVRLTSHSSRVCSRARRRRRLTLTHPHPQPTPNSKPKPHRT
jgi:hypothetical protein